jgi:hypothetical protein
MNISEATISERKHLRTLCLQLDWACIFSLSFIEALNFCRRVVLDLLAAAGRLNQNREYANFRECRTHWLRCRHKFLSAE